MAEHLFTSESVTEGHPDKIADQVSDGVLDAVLADDPYGRVACETLITTGQVMVAGEISTSTYVDIPAIARATIRRIGYTRAKYGFDADTCGVSVAIDEQSTDMPKRWRDLPSERWDGTLEFFGSQRPASPMAWSFLFDIVHHRGQITPSLRPMGSTVPQIYGPSADEP